MAAFDHVLHDQGSRVYLPYRYVDEAGDPKNITGSTAVAQVRECFADDDATVICEFSSTAGTILIGGADVDPTNGQVVIDTADNIDLVDFDAGDYEWDLFLVAADGTPKRLVAGPWTQRPRVTVVTP